MKAQIITIGDEILIGQIVDTNSAFISSFLESIGVMVISILSISDNRDAIASALTLSLKEFDITITTGGLGPTRDDITKDVLCTIFGCKMELHQPTYDFVKSMLEAKGIVFNYLNESQAYLPSAANVIPNHNGTAPGLWFERDNRLLFNLPGVPFEMKPLITDYVNEIIRSKYSLPYIVHKTVVTFGLPESILAETIASWEDNLPQTLRLAYLPSTGGVRLRLTFRSATQSDGLEVIDHQFNLLEKIIGGYILGYGSDVTVESTVAKMLLDSGSTLSVAESCTGGKISSRFTLISGASAYYLGGVVAYSNEVKINLLGVSKISLEKFGAVSEQVACEMAEGIRAKTGSTYSIATTGIAGPTGYSESKPVGTVWIAVCSKHKTVVKCHSLSKLRDVNIDRSSSLAISMLGELIKEENK